MNNTPSMLKTPLVCIPTSSNNLLPARVVLGTVLIRATSSLGAALQDLDRIPGY